MYKNLKLAVVIPCYNVKYKISKVLASIGQEVDYIYVIDDCCPEDTGNFVRNNIVDVRIKVIAHIQNAGVGGAVITGYQNAIEDGADVIVKIDGDGQMNSSLITVFIDPIVDGLADYTKGNRFFNLESLSAMPRIRLIGNSFLSFLTKLSSGYWDVFDPTNGYTAINAAVALDLPLHKINKRYFFESDMLFRLNILRAVVADIPISALYGDEKSGLRISKIIIPFIWGHTKNLLKRIFYNYYLRDMSVASFELPLGLGLFLFGAIFGLFHWISAFSTGVATPAGTVMIAAISIIVGIQLLLSFLAYDISFVPRRPIGLAAINKNFILQAP